MRLIFITGHHRLHGKIELFAGTSSVHERDGQPRGHAVIILIGQILQGHSYSIQSLANLKRLKAGAFGLHKIIMHVLSGTQSGYQGGSLFVTVPCRSPPEGLRPIEQLVQRKPFLEPCSHIRSSAEIDHSKLTEQSPGVMFPSKIHGSMRQSYEIMEREVQTWNSKINPRT